MTTPAIEHLLRRLRKQAASCAELGSPLYEALLSGVADDVTGGGPCATLLAPHADDPRGSALALRLMGAVHRLVLRDEAPTLARFYPSAGGTVGDGAWPAFRELVASRLDTLRTEIDRGVQTNEVGRSAALYCGLVLAAREGPLHLLEVGASAGLNLRFDRYRYEIGDRVAGDPESDVVLATFDPAALPPADARIRVAGRRGCDRSPLDANAAADREMLLSFVWADQAARIARLRAALEIARSAPAPVDRADAPEWLEAALDARPDAGPTVVMHSIVMQYLSPEARAAIDAIFEAVGARATETAPLFRLAMEPAGPLAAVSLTRWPGGERRVVAEAGYHGDPVRFV